MKLSIGENIKVLRKSRDITQEQLAEMLGISCQSVSRWELGACYPDMELLPILAEIFEVTVDKLLGIDDIAKKKKVDEYLNQFQTAINKGEIDRCISIAREGVKEYPNNYALLNKLMYALFVSGNETGNISNWKENMDKYDAEITALGERIMKYCPDTEIRSEAASRLAFNHCEHGRKKIGRQIYETLPTMTFCRENQMWWCLEEDEKVPFLQKQIKESYNILNVFMRILATCGKLSPEESISVINKVEALKELIFDGNKDIVNLFESSRIHYDKAKLYAKIGNAKETINELNLSAKKAIDFDNRPEIQEYNSLLLGTVEERRINFETADSRPLAEIMRDELLANEAFNFIEDTPELKRIIAVL